MDRKIAAQLINSGKGKNAVSPPRNPNRAPIALEEDEDELTQLKADQRYVCFLSQAMCTDLESCLSSLPVPLGSRLLRAVLYGASVFVSFFLMLVFMTYNVSILLHFVSLSDSTTHSLGVSHSRDCPGCCDWSLYIWWKDGP